MKRAGFVLIFCLPFCFVYSEAGEVASSLSFAQAYQKMLENSLRVDSQKFKIEIAKAQSLKPLEQFLPAINLVGKEMQSGDPRTEQRPLNIAASLNLFRFGADTLELKSSDLNRKSQEEKLLSEKLDSEDESLAAIFAVVRLATSFEVYQGTSNARAELSRIAEERFRKGLLALQEVEKIRIDFEMLRQERLMFSMNCKMHKQNCRHY